METTMTAATTDPGRERSHACVGACGGHPLWVAAAAAAAVLAVAAAAVAVALAARSDGVGAPPAAGAARAAG